MIRTFALVFVLYIVTLNAVVGDETPTSSSSQVDAIVESVVNSMNDPYLANNLGKVIFKLLNISIDINFKFMLQFLIVEWLLLL